MSAPSAEPNRRDAMDAHAEPLALVQETLGLVTWIWDIGQPPVWHGDLSPLLGLPRGGHRHDLPGWIDRLHPDDRAAAHERFIACLKGRLPVYRAEERVLWPDGSVHWLETLGRGTYGPDGRATRMVGVVSDVTERKRNELALLATDARFRRVIEDAPIAIGIARGDDMRWVNPAYLRLFGFTHTDEVIGRPATERVAPASRAEYIDRAERRLRGEPVETRYQFEAQRRDGSRFTAQATVTPTEFEGGRAALAFLEDVSERERNAQALRALNAGLEQRVAARTAELEAINAELARARDAAEAATRAKGAFVANMSHEIRTPLNAIVALGALVQHEPGLPPQVGQHLQRIRQASDLLLALVDDVLDFSKIEAGKLELRLQPLDLRAALARVVAVVGAAAAAKGLALRSEVAPDLPRAVHGDAVRIGQVLLNLCGNAVKFTERGEIVVAVRTAPGRVLCEVRDTGIGIAAGEAERLFQPFGQLDSSPTRRHGGTGLGLAISRELVALMGGEIGLVSEPGRGSRFHFWFPLVPAPAVDDEAAAPALPAGTPLRGRHLLLVEDNELNRIVATELLQRIGGAAVEIATNGREALERLAARSFDAVLMDVQMPEMDGLAATEALRRDPRFAALPVIAMTAHALAEDRARCLAAGMNDFVTKPIEAGRLFAVLARWLPAPG